MCFLIRTKLSRDYVTVNALIPGILKSGCKKYDSRKKIFRKAEELYGAVFDAAVMKKGDEQIIEFYMEILDSDGLLKQALEFMKNIIVEPLVIDGGFNEQFVENEKVNLKNTIEGRINNKKEYARLRCIEEMFPDEPFGLYADGYTEDLKNINPKNCYEHYLELLNNSPIEFILIGNKEQNETEKLIKDVFKDLKNSNNTNFENIEVSAKNRTANTVTENADISQAKLCIGIETGLQNTGDDFYKLLVANEILGGGASSRLFLNVREKESLCYYIGSVLFRFKSFILCQAGIEADKLEKVLELIKAQIEDIKSGNVNKNELDTAVKGLIKKYSSISDYPASSMDFYLAQYMLSDKTDINGFADSLKKVSLEDVAETAQSFNIDTVYVLKGDN